MRTNSRLFLGYSQWNSWEVVRLRARDAVKGIPANSRESAWLSAPREELTPPFLFVPRNCELSLMVSSDRTGNWLSKLLAHMKIGLVIIAKVA